MVKLNQAQMFFRATAVKRVFSHAWKAGCCCYPTLRVSVMNKIACILSICLACASLQSQAQVYKWIDKDGKIQYSDSPPPAGSGASVPQKLDTSASNSSGVGGPAKDQSWQDKARDYDKRRIEAAEKQAGDIELARKNQERCNSARRELRRLQEVGRVFKTDNQGERHYLNDDQRQDEIARAQGVVSELCK
jgi:hypothetical protein